MPLIVCGVMLDSTESSQPLRSHMLSVCTLTLPLFSGGCMISRHAGGGGGGGGKEGEFVYAQY